MATSRVRAKGRRDQRTFVKAYRDILESPEYAALSSGAVKLLLDIYSQYRGFNNGDLIVAFTLMKTKGWGSKRALYRARDELLDRRFIIPTRRRINRKVDLFAVTFERIDECSGKLDCKETDAPSNDWKVNHLREKNIQMRSESCKREKVKKKTQECETKPELGAKRNLKTVSGNETQPETAAS